MPHFKRSELLRRTLLSIKYQECKPSFEVVVVNDGPQDDALVSICREFLYDKDFGGDIRVFNTQRDYPYRGPALPWNAAAVRSRGEFIILQSPECLHVGPVMGEIVGALEASEQNTYVALRCVELQRDDLRWLDHNEQYWPIYPEILSHLKWPLRQEYAGPNSHNREPLYFTAGMRRDAYLGVGGLDERFTHAGFEDNHFLYILRKNRFRIETHWEAPYYTAHQYHAKPSCHEDRVFASLARVMCTQLNSLVKRIESGQHPAKSNPDHSIGVLSPDAEVEL